MLIGNSVPEYIFIRITVFLFRSIAPLSILYTVITLLGISIFEHQPSPGLGRWPYRLPLPLEIYAFCETAFCLLIYSPLWIYLQKAAVHPRAPSQDERRELFEKILESVPNLEHYLSGWFLRSPHQAIQRDNVKEFIAWSLLNEHAEKLNATQSKEIDGYIDELEHRLGREFKLEGRSTPSLRTTFDHVPMQHRPLLWYMIVFFIDQTTHIRLIWSGLNFYRSDWSSTLAIFPPRPLTWLGVSQKPVGKLSYWYRPHQSKSRLPVVFIHGIGIGLYTYADFIAQMIARQPGDDGDVGIVVVEILPISSRICAPALTTPEMRSQIQQILDFHGWKDFVLAGHSYGTAIASTILKDPELSSRVKSAILMDPICFLLHLPDVAYNFTRRPPNHANERMLQYFSSTDMLISHTLARRFFWSEYILWKDDIVKQTRLVVTLSAKDLIVPTPEVWQYLTNSSEPSSRNDKALEGTEEWKKDNVEVLRFTKFDHAGLFNSRGARRGVASIVRRLCEVNSIESDEE